jgi:hypothetical protein
MAAIPYFTRETCSESSNIPIVLYIMITGSANISSHRDREYVRPQARAAVLPANLPAVSFLAPIMATVSAQDGDEVKIAEPTRERRKQRSDLSVSPLQYPYSLYRLFASCPSSKLVGNTRTCQALAAFVCLSARVP